MPPQSAKNQQQRLQYLKELLELNFAQIMTPMMTVTDYASDYD